MFVIHLTSSGFYPTAWKRGDIIVCEKGRFLITENTGSQVTLIRYRWYHRILKWIRWIP